MSVALQFLLEIENLVLHLEAKIKTDAAKHLLLVDLEAPFRCQCLKRVWKPCCFLSCAEQGWGYLSYSKEMQGSGKGFNFGECCPEQTLGTVIPQCPISQNFISHIKHKT